MSLEVITNINVDFYDKKYILINAKQYDDVSRWISITCYDNGGTYNLNASKHTAYIRYRKADGYGVLNSCRINYKGQVLVELTEQMLAADGICYVDLIVVDKGNAIVNIDTGEVITIDGSPILSTMAFCINVYEAAFDNSLVESSYEYNALNEALKKSEADYKEVIQLSKSYAVGDANNIRENEDYDNSKYYSELSRSYAIGDAGGVRTNENTDNSKYYSEQSHNSAISADESEANALASEKAALASENAALASENASKEYAEASAVSAEASATSASESAESASESENNMNSAMASASSASESEVNANASASSASESAASASDSASSASKSAESAAKSEANALESASNIASNVDVASNMAEIASTSAASASESANVATESANVATESATSAFNSATSANASASAASNSATSATESATEAHTYLLQVEEITTGLSGAFLPMGTVEFAELSTLLANGEVQAGYLYNISDNFTTDDTFKRGAGIEYAAGTNVYRTSDGCWDCLTGLTVVGVKGEKESEYRVGNVNLTSENVGAIPNTNIATVEEVKSYLGI